MVDVGGLGPNGDCAAVLTTPLKNGFPSLTEFTGLDLVIILR